MPSILFLIFSCLPLPDLLRLHANSRGRGRTENSTTSWRLILCLWFQLHVMDVWHACTMLENANIYIYIVHQRLLVCVSFCLNEIVFFRVSYKVKMEGKYVIIFDLLWYNSFLFPLNSFWLQKILFDAYEFLGSLFFFFF